MKYCKECSERTESLYLNVGFYKDKTSKVYFCSRGEFVIEDTMFFIKENNFIQTDFFYVDEDISEEILMEYLKDKKFYYNINCPYYFEYKVEE